MSDAMSSAKSGLSNTRSSMTSISSGLKGLNIIGEDTVAKISTAASAMQIFTGATSMIMMAKARTEVQNVKATAKASALTATVSMTGIGLTNVAVAVAAAAGASVAMYAVVSTLRIKADTNNSADRGRVNAIVGGAIGGQ